MAGTHFRNPVMFAGLSNNTKWFKDLPVDHNPNYVVFNDDFIGASLAQPPWNTSLADGGASAVTSTVDLNGNLTIASAATTDNNGACVVTGSTSWQPAAKVVDSTGATTNPGSTIWFESRLKSADVDQTNFGAGLVVTGISGSEGWSSANRISIESADGIGNIQFVTDDAAGTTTTNYTTGAGTLTDATYITVGFKAHGTSQVDFYVNRMFAGTHTANIPTDELQGFLASVSGDATGTKSTDFDYWYCVNNRNASELRGNI